ncbi:MAG: DUF4434 domain-containing protein [Pseudazoarcus pumilus]|nr:DUF4434 domain-containing protein [Pseudazoarcus pumilus]
MKRWMILLWLAVCLPAHADGVLFYQPLNVDEQVAEDDWRGVLDGARTAGVHTLIVQWTRHGDSTFGGRDGWLMQRLRAAERSGLRLILGLAFDPSYYQRMADGQAVTMQWYQWLADSLAQQRWLRDHGGLQVAGWYLPLELDDYIFADAGLRQTLARQLAVFRAQLDAPLHISTVSAGVLTPEMHADWLAGLPVDQVWWQDGLGTATLAPEVLHAYRAALPCSIGIVAEAFAQTSDPREPFAARPATPRMDTGCHARAVFSLRYRPWGAVLLHNQRAAK